MIVYQYDALRYPERSAFSLRKLTTSSCAPGWMPHDLAIRRVRMPPPMAHPIPLADRRYACATVASRPPQFAIPRLINLIITVDQYVAKPDHSAQLESGPPGLGPLSQESSTPHRLSQAGAPLPNETSDRPHRRSTLERAGSKCEPRAAEPDTSSRLT